MEIPSRSTDAEVLAAIERRLNALANEIAQLSDYCNTLETRLDNQIDRVAQRLEDRIDSEERERDYRDEDLRRHIERVEYAANHSRY